uniref:Nanos-type domain-containing protein n=1 Tax=Elaeophora elaphi TaxID=1147741 RepID=A0A0R3RSC0_9BILA
MSYKKGITEDAQSDQLIILHKNTGHHFSSDLLINLPTLVSLTTHLPILDTSDQENYSDTKKYTSDPWLLTGTTSTLVNLHADFSALLHIWKPSVELGNKNEVSHKATAVTVKKGLPNEMALSFTPHVLPLKSLRKGITAMSFTYFFSAGNKKEDKCYCVFCFNNARFTYEKRGSTLDPALDGPWRNHVCKNSKGAVICPVLFAHVCRYCGATGKFAHTEKYCDSQKKRNKLAISYKRTYK